MRLRSHPLQLPTQFHVCLSQLVDALQRANEGSLISQWIASRPESLDVFANFSGQGINLPGRGLKVSNAVEFCGESSILQQQFSRSVADYLHSFQRQT